MKWRYGIVKYKDKKNPEYSYYSVGELYFINDPLKPFACTEEPVSVICDHDEWVVENPEESIIKQLKMMLKDCKKYPAFDAEGPFEKFPEDDNDQERE